MEEPLASSDHLSSSEGGAEGVAWRPEEESGGEVVEPHGMQPAFGERGRLAVFHG